MEKLTKYLEQSDQAISVLSSQLGYQLDDLMFQIVLAAKMGLSEKESSKIPDYDLTSKDMLDLVSKSDFPVFSEDILLSASILPQDLPTRIDEQTIKVKGELWRIHLYDADHCPSNPHAHNVDTGVKLHLGTGELYDSKCNPLDSKIKSKHLGTLRSKVYNKIDLPPLA